MNSCCTLFHIDPTTLPTPVKIEEIPCDPCNCNCGYIQYETLGLDMTKLSNSFTKNEDHIALEGKLKREIVEISRLFDAATGVEPGTYSRAHTKLIKLFGNGTNMLRIPEFVKGSLELYTMDGYLINPTSYEYKDGYLMYQPCIEHHRTCGCINSCGYYANKATPPGWNGCLQAVAKFGKECSDKAVELAVRSYLIEWNTFGDTKLAVKDGFITQRFKQPDAWVTLVEAYKQKKRSFNYFAIA